MMIYNYHFHIPESGHYKRGAKNQYDMTIKGLFLLQLNSLLLEYINTQNS